MRFHRFGPLKQVDGLKGVFNTPRTQQAPAADVPAPSNQALPARARPPSLAAAAPRTGLPPASNLAEPAGAAAGMASPTTLPPRYPSPPRGRDSSLPGYGAHGTDTLVAEGASAPPVLNPVPVLPPVPSGSVAATSAASSSAPLALTIESAQMALQSRRRPEARERMWNSLEAQALAQGVELNRYVNPDGSLTPEGTHLLAQPRD